MNTFKIKPKLFLLLILFYFISCDQSQENDFNSNPSTNQSEILSKTAYEKEEIERTISLGLAKSMKYESIREFVKTNALKKFDGDYNFLFIPHGSSEIVINQNGHDIKINFGKLIYQLANGIEEKDINTEYNRFIENIQLNHPLVQIAIVQSDEIHPKGWNTTSEVPKVVYKSNSLFNDKKLLPAYNVNGKYTEIDGILAPKEIVLAVYENERADFINVSELSSALRNSDNKSDIIREINALYKDDTNLYYLLEDYYDRKYIKDIESLYNLSANSNMKVNEPIEVTEPGGGGGTGGGTSSCPRLNKEDQYDILHKVKFNGKSAFSRANEGDTFFEYSLEFKVILIFSQNVGNISTLEKFFVGRDGDFKNCFLTCNWIYKEINLPTIKWKRNVQGEFIKYQFYELDGGSNTTVTTNFTNLIIGDNGSTSTINSSISYQVQSGDDDLFSEFVEYCDNIEGGGSEYTTGALQFIIKK